MKSFAIACLLGATSAFTTMQNGDYEFMRFVAKYGKTYGTKEEFEFRAAIFKTHLAEVEALNSQNSTSTHGINKFADLTKDEKKRFLTGYVHTETNGVYAEFTAPTDSEVDWVKAGAVTAVKNQGQCGSCWAFSTTGSIEGAEFIAHGTLNALSEQQLVDCSRLNHGCNGGSMALAFRYAKNHPLVSESDYAYTAVDGTCSIPSGAATLTHVTGSTNVTPNSESAI